MASPASGDTFNAVSSTFKTATYVAGGNVNNTIKKDSRSMNTPTTTEVSRSNLQRKVQKDGNISNMTAEPTSDNYASAQMPSKISLRRYHSISSNMPFQSSE
jgi:hypothetical protein